MNLNRDDVLRMAREAGGEYRGQYDLHQMTSVELERLPTGKTGASGL